MLNINDEIKVYIACGVTDLRKSVDGLSLIVSESFQLDPFSNSMFVFCNRKKDKLKILHWEHNGYWLYYKRLEISKFSWPSGQLEKNMETTMSELRALLDGYEIRKGKKHKEVLARQII